MKKYLIIISVLFGFSSMIWATEDSPSPQLTTLHDILKNPLSFADKAVILKGIFAQRNCNYCFMYKEGIESIKIAPKGFFSPKFNPGTRILVKGIVRITHEKEITIEAIEVKKQ